MSTTLTPHLGLVQDLSDEPVKTHHVHANANLAALDTAIKDLQDAVANARAIFGNLGMDVNDEPVIDNEEALENLGFNVGFLAETTWDDMEQA